MINKEEVLQLILNEKIKIDRFRTKNELTQWFWKVGFREISIDEHKKAILCEVSRPNQFISKFNKSFINFLIHISSKILKTYGYTFELKKYTKDEYYNVFKNYLDTLNEVL